MSPMKNNDLLVVLVALATSLAVIYFFKPDAPEPVPENPNAPFSEDCVFYRKTMGGDMVISEPSAGTYRYELYATTEGIEVWKCNNF